MANSEYQSYGSYLGRVISLIIAGALILLAVWFVIQLATGGDDETDVANNNDTSQVASGDDITADDVDEALANQSDGDGQVAGDDTDGAGEDDSQTNGQTMSTNTDELPSTGPGVSAIILSGGAAAIATRIKQRRS